MPEPERTSQIADRPDPGAPPSPWSPMATLGLTIVVLVVFLALQVLVTLGLAALEGPAAADAPAANGAPQWNGWLLSIGLIVSAPIAIALILWFARQRGGIARSLGLQPVSAWGVAGWIVIVVAFIIATDLITQRLEQPVVPDFMLEAYRTAGFLPLFWVAVVVAAPVFEETLFRGFLYGGIERSRLGGAGAVVFTALGWTLLHMQYELYHLTIVFGAGLLLGLARWRSGSLWTPLIMHVVWNLIATAQVAFGPPS